MWGQEQGTPADGGHAALRISLLMMHHHHSREVLQPWLLCHSECQSRHSRKRPILDGLFSVLSIQQEVCLVTCRTGDGACLNHTMSARACQGTPDSAVQPSDRVRRHSVCLITGSCWAPLMHLRCYSQSLHPSSGLCALLGLGVRPCEKASYSILWRQLWPARCCVPADAAD
jgi:hypothetical protein